MKLAVRLLALLSFAVTVAAQAAYPDKPVKVIHGFAAGGGADIFLRNILPAFSENLRSRW